MADGSMSDAASGLGSGIGSIFGYYLTGDNREKAQEDYENALKAIQGTGGSTALDQGPSAYGSASIDPADRQAQLQALGQLQSIYSSGGLDPATRAQLNQVQQSNDMKANALQGAIQNRMQQQGMGSSGASIAAQEQAAQQAAQNDYNAGTNAAALGANRQMQAIQGAAGIGAGLQQQDWQQASQKAAAQDAISRFNAQNQTQNNQFNADLGLQRARAEAGAYGGMAQDQKDQAKQEQAAAQGIGGTLGSLAGGVAQAFTGGLF